MDTKEGSYIRYGRQDWRCEDCKTTIKATEQHFVRVKVDTQVSRDSKGNYYNKREYKRWHLNCALNIKKLNDFEKTLLGPVLMALHMRQDAQIGGNLAQNEEIGVKTEIGA